MKKLMLREISPVGFFFARSESERRIVLIMCTFFILLLSVMLTGCFTTTTPLHNAAFEGNARVVKELLDKGANIDEGTSSDPGYTPLTYAAYANAPLEIVKLLIEKGANVNATSKWGETPLSASALNRRRDIASFLVGKGANIDKAIVFLDRQRRQEAVEFLYGLKKEMTDSSQSQGLKTAALVKSSPAIKSDVDDLPAIKLKSNKQAYSIVIGIEQYRQKLPKADYATQDAKAVTEYLTKVMGYPEENVVTLLNENATNVDLAKYFEKWLYNNVEKDSTVFIYYSGHGAPNTKTGDAYLVPYDGDPSFIEQTGYPLKRLYESLKKLPAKEIIVALDSCFSGAGGRSVIAKGARPLVMNLQSGVALARNISVLSASSSEQISSTYDEKGHGLFTYFLLKGLRNENVVKPDGSIRMDDLYGYIKPQVERIARKQYNNEQSPQLIRATSK